MIVYLIEHNNGESWEDYHKWIGKCFSTQEKAKQHLINTKYRYNKKHDTWSMKMDEYTTYYAEIVEIKVN